MRGPGRARSTLEILVFAEPGSQLENRVSGLLHHPRALLFEGSLLPGQRGAVMDSGSLQSSALLLLPHITYARLGAHIRLPARGGWRDHSFCRAAAAAWGASGVASQPWQQQQQPRFEQGWRTLSKPTRLQAESAMELGGSLQSLLAPSQAGLAKREELSGRRGSTPKLLGAHRHSSSRHGFCTSVLWTCSCACGAVPGPRIS